MGVLDAPAVHPRAIVNDSIWAMGDSITANGYTAPAGAVSHLFGKQSYTAWACLASVGRLRFGGVAATGGYTTAQVVTTHLPAVLAAKPAYCVVHAGTNDIGSLTITQTIANLKTIYDSLLAVGTIPICTTMLPKHTLLGASRAPLDRMGIWVTQYARQKNIPVVDLTTPFINPSTGDWTGYSGGTGPYNSDDVHPSGAGAKVIGEAVWAAIEAYAPPRSAFFPGQNLQGASGFYPSINNALHLTDTNGDGVPDNYTGNVGAGRTFSRTDMTPDEGLGKWFTAAWDSGASAPFPQGSPSAAIAGNQMLYVVKVKTSGIEASGAKWHLRITDNNTADVLSMRTMDQDVALGGFSVLWTVPTGIGGGSLKFTPYVDSVAGASISVGQVGIYDLTAQSIPVP